MKAVSNICFVLFFKYLFVFEGNMFQFIFFYDIFCHPGTSDPYLKCMHGQDKLFLTESIKKTVNPQWDEHFSVCMEAALSQINY